MEKSKAEVLKPLTSNSNVFSEGAQLQSAGSVAPKAFAMLESRDLKRSRLP
jgi:hypothetical protein